MVISLVRRIYSKTNNLLLIFDKKKLEELRISAPSEAFEATLPPENPFKIEAREAYLLKKRRLFKDAQHRNPAGVAARAAVRKALASGLLEKQECQLDESGCLRWPVEAHHESYDPDHWLDVVWVCKACHGRLTQRG